MSRSAPTYTPDAPDFSDASALATALMAQAERIRALAPANADARAILAFSSDRQNVILAVATKRAREAGCKSNAEAETYAMASDEYQVALVRLEQDHRDAERVAQQYRAEETKFEALRTATSLQKAIASQV